MKILILGSDGQIGLSLRKYLSKNHDVIEFDISSDIHNDLRVPNVLDSILPTVDFVFFLAFDVGGSAYIKKYQDSFEFISNNIKIMNNTFDSLKKYNNKFIFTSSQMSNMLHSSYGVLKQIGEKYTKSLKNGKIISIWNIYGYEKDLNKSHVMTDFILMAKSDNIIKMRTNGEEKRQFLYVKDCCKCLTFLMDNFDTLNRIQFDISSFKWEKIIDIAKIISSEFNNCPIIIGDEEDEVQMNISNEPSKYILQYWEPEISTKEGVKKMIQEICN